MELADVFARNEEIISRRIVDELILVPVRRNVADMETLYTLNDVGARVYELIDGAKSLGAIVETIVSEFEVSPSEAQQDVFAFVEQLVEIDSVRRVGDTD